MGLDSSIHGETNTGKVRVTSKDFEVHVMGGPACLDRPYKPYLTPPYGPVGACDVKAYVMAHLPRLDRFSPTISFAPRPLPCPALPCPALPCPALPCPPLPPG